MIYKTVHGLKILEIDGYKFPVHKDSFFLTDSLWVLWAWWDGKPMFENTIRASLRTAIRQGIVPAR